MKHIVRLAAISIIIGTLGCNVVLADMARTSFLRPRAFEEKSEEAKIAEYVARQPVLGAFQHNAKVFRHFASQEAAKIIEMISKPGSYLNELFSRVKIPIRLKRSSEPQLGERHSATVLEAIGTNINAVSGIVNETYVGEEYADTLEKALANIEHMVMIVGEQVSEEDEEAQDLKLLADKIIALQFSCRLFTSCAAVLRNGRHFQSGNFDRDVIKFVKNPQYPLLDRGNVACAVCFVQHTVGGLAELCVLERGMSEEQRAANEEAIKMTINDIRALDPEALRMAVFDLFARLVEARDSDELAGVCRLLNYFREEEKSLDFGLVDKEAVVSKILSVGDSVKDLDTARELAMLLVSFDKEKALEVIKTGRPEALLHFVFMSLETMLEMDLLDAGLAQEVRTALENRFNASQWPDALTPVDLRQHTARPSHLRLCEKLSPINNSDLRNEGLFRAFQLNYLQKKENYQLDKFIDAFGRAYEAASRTPRHLFLPTFTEPWADEDIPLGIPFGCGQTISQPSLVQLMTALVDPRDSDKALEIGTGSGYQTALLARLTRKVYTIEVYKQLSERAKRVCGSLGLNNITFHPGDGSEGWPTEAPFDIIVVTAEAPDIPSVLLRQLNPQDGRLLIPVRNREKGYAELTLVVRRGDRYETAPIGPTKWVRLVGASGYGFETPLPRQPFIDFSPPPMKKEIHSPNILQLSAI